MASSPPAPDTGGQAEEPRSAAARLFDIRLLIGGLFVLYGIILFVVGLTDSAASRAKADGIDINLWMGIAMFGIGVLFLLWHRVNPLHPVTPDETTAGGRLVAPPGDPEA